MNVTYLRKLINAELPAFNQLETAAKTFQILNITELPDQFYFWFQSLTMLKLLEKVIRKLVFYLMSVKITQ